MELDKAIDRLKAICKQCHNSKECWDNEFCSDCYIEVEDVLAIETVLRALEDYKKNLYRVNDENVKIIVLIHDLQQQLKNSVSKDKIKKFIKENSYTDTYNFKTVEVSKLQELLGE